MPSLKFISQDEFTEISIDEMKNYLKVDSDITDDDDLIIGMIKSAVEKIEKYCNILLRACTLDVIFDDFDIDEGEVILPLIPCSQVSNVYLIDSQGVETEQTTFYQTGLNLKEIKIPGWSEDYKIRIRYIAGYGIETVDYETESIPEIAKQAIYKIVSDWYENRDSQIIPGEVRRMLTSISYKSWM